MSRFIVKPDRAEDFYVYWSTIVDDVLACGSRTELSGWLAETEGANARDIAQTVRFGRADRTGTSSPHGGYGWAVEVFNLGQYSEPRYVKRENLSAYARALMSGGPDAAIVHTAPTGEPAEFRSRFQPPADAPRAMDGRIPEDFHEDDGDRTTLTIPGDPKMIREALCVAEHATLWNVDEQNRHGAREVLGALIQECDRHRPLGPDGKHGQRHTATCGCDDVPERYRVAEAAQDGQERAGSVKSEHLTRLGPLTVMSTPEPKHRYVSTGPVTGIKRCACGAAWTDAHVAGRRAAR